MNFDYCDAAEKEGRDARVVQSYVLDEFFVSTIYRQSSASVESPPWFYETLVWEWDDVTKERGALIYQTEGINAHGEIIGKLIRGLPLDGDE